MIKVLNKRIQTSCFIRKSISQNHRAIKSACLKVPLIDKENIRIDKKNIKLLKTTKIYILFFSINQGRR